MDDFGVREGAGADGFGVASREAAGELAAVGVADADDFAGVEIAFAAGDAGQEEAAALFAEGATGAVIDEEAAAGVVEEGDPAFAAWELAGAGAEEGALLLAGEDAGEDVAFAAAGDDEGEAGAHGDAGGFEFGDHAANGGRAGGAGGPAEDLGVEALDGGQDVGVGLAVMGDDALDAGEDNEEVGRQEGGDERGEAVVIAELEFFERDDVVFVDDGDDAAVEEGEEGVAGVEVAVVIGEVGVGEEDLGDGEAELLEEVAVEGHEAGLADGGAGLELVELGGAAGEAEDAHAGADGTGGDEDDLAAGAALFGQLGDQLDELEEIGLFPAVGEDAGAEFDDEAGDAFEQLAPHSNGVPERAAEVESPYLWGQSLKSEC